MKYTAKVIPSYKSQWPVISNRIWYCVLIPSVYGNTSLIQPIKCKHCRQYSVLFGRTQLVILNVNLFCFLPSLPYLREALFGLNQKEKIKNWGRFSMLLRVLFLFPWQRPYWHAAVLLLEDGPEPGSTLPAHNLTLCLFASAITPACRITHITVLFSISVAGKISED